MIKSETFNFLHEIAINNDRNWFQDHKEDYTIARENVIGLIGEILKKLSKIDPSIPSDLNPQSCLMRIYRDVRFSKNKAPYKKNFGIAISGNGKNFNGAGYYINVQPANSFIAAGHWMPETGHLKAIRQEIDYNGEEFHRIIDDPAFKLYFSKFDEEDKLKTSPKGYPSDHPDIEYLRLKSFAVAHEVKDEELKGADAISKIMSVFEAAYPLMVFLRNAIS